MPYEKVQALIDPTFKRLFDVKREQTGDTIKTALEKAIVCYACISEDVIGKLYENATAKNSTNEFGGSKRLL